MTVPTFKSHQRQQSCTVCTQSEPDWQDNVQISSCLYISVGKIITK